MLKLLKRETTARFTLQYLRGCDRMKRKKNKEKIKIKMKKQHQSKYHDGLRISSRIRLPWSTSTDLSRGTSVAHTRALNKQKENDVKTNETTKQIALPFRNWPHSNADWRNRGEIESCRCKWSAGGSHWIPAVIYRLTFSFIIMIFLKKYFRFV